MQTKQNTIHNNKKGRCTDKNIIKTAKWGNIYLVVICIFSDALAGIYVKRRYLPKKGFILGVLEIIFLSIFYPFFIFSLVWSHPCIHKKIK